MSNYITEAFKQLNLLESEDISLDASGITELRSFLDDAAVDPDEEMMDIYDLKAEAEEDLAKSYEGKVVLECTVCHSHIFEDKENISMDEEGEACKDIECPYCMSNEGYFILGEIAPFNQEEADSFAEDDDELDEVDIEGAADDIDDEDIIEESLNEAHREEKWDRKHRKIKEKDLKNGKSRSENTMDSRDLGGLEAYKKNLKEAWEEEFESEYDYIVNNDSLSKEEKDAALSKLFSEYGMNESMKLDGVEELYDNDEIRGVEELEGVDELEGVEALHGDKHEDPINEACDKEAIKEGCDKELKEDIEDVSVTTEDETMTMTTKEDGGVVIETIPKEDEEIETESEEEMIVPISDESSEVIDASVDALDSDDEEDFEALKDEMEEAEDETAEEEPAEETTEDEFDEFDEESFDGLGESYLRSCYENVTNFKTSSIASQGNKLFIEGIIKFDSGNEKKTNFVFESIGNNKFEGYNEQISRGKKTFKLSGSVKDNKLVCESLNYNYRSKNELNESVRVYGTVKRK